jgi:alpha-galactosidase
MITLISLVSKCRPRHLSLALISLTTVLAGALLLQAQTNLSGVWVLKVPRGDETFRKSWFEVKQEGQTVTLSQLSGRSPDLPAPAGRGGPAAPGGRAQAAPPTGTFVNGKLHFEMAGRGFGQKQPPPATVYDGTLEGSRIALTVTGGRGGTSTAILERSTLEASYPKRIPPPELHPVKSNGLAKTPPMGWNSWNLFADRVDDKTVRGIADAMVESGMKKAGYVYVNIDDTWEGESRDAQGNMTTNSKFPNMKALADYVHSKGLKIGIYSSPGPNTCAGYEGSYGHEEQDAKTFAAWGIDYLKYDWCGANRVYTGEEEHAVYQRMGDALLKAGRPIVYSLCQYGQVKVWEWGALVGGNLWRTTGDIGDRWQSMHNIGFGTAIPGGLTQLDIAQHSKIGLWNDPDMLEIGNGGMTTDEYKTHFTLWSMLRSPLLAGNDIRKMTPETKEILLNAEVIAVNQDPAGLAPKLVSHEGTSDVISRPLKDKSTAVALFNRGDQPATITVKWEALGLKGKKLRGRDLWKHQDVTLSGDGFSAQVPTHGVVVLKVSAK